MKTEISIRDYQAEDVQALANIYYNTIIFREDRS